VLIVHRPKYDDWTLPKGKLEPGERHKAAAVREVFEETGIRARLGSELASTAYRDRYGRRKRVRYWLMEVDGGEFAPNQEVDEVRWVDADSASRMLTYARDRRVLGSLATAR
jgi:8-oxo-dGTP pyrophosphatase MutT (NUDIX family)